MIDSFSFIHFDLPHMIFKAELALKLNLSFKEILVQFKKPTLLATGFRFFTLTSNCINWHYFSVFMTSWAVKNNSLDDVDT